jgi:hypothetical protein
VQVQIKNQNLLARSFLILSLLIALQMPAFGQFDNSAFYQSKRKFEDGRGLYGGLNTMGFLRNKEYFNNVASGYTLFGFQFNPYLSWQAGDNFRLDGGLYLLKDFGFNQFNQVQPTFSFTYFEPGVKLIFGNLDGALNHRLIEPLFNFENSISRRQETGLQLIVENDRIFWDTWIDWRNMIYPADKEQEEFVVGTSAFLVVKDADEFTVGLPLQATLLHKGGQIDILNLPVYSLLNYSIAASLAWEGGEYSQLKEVKFEPYWSFFRKVGDAPDIPFDKGEGWMLNLTVRTSGFYSQVSYWNGIDFFSPIGGYLYSSLSSRFDRPGYYESRRELIIFRFFKDIKIENGLSISLRFEPYYDKINKKWEQAAGIYFNYTPTFFVAKPKLAK